MVGLLQPLTIGEISLSAGDMLDLPGVGQKDLKATRLQDLKQRNPIHPGRFHRHGLNATRRQPLGQGLQISGEGVKASHRLLVPIRRDRDVAFGRPDVDAGGIQVESLKAGRQRLFRQ